MVILSQVQLEHKQPVGEVIHTHPADPASVRLPKPYIQLPVEVVSLKNPANIPDLLAVFASWLNAGENLRVKV